eukprot:3515210-Ditylum_brightwellii.AAC.1
MDSWQTDSQQKDNTPLGVEDAVIIGLNYHVIGGLDMRWPQMVRKCCALRSSLVNMSDGFILPPMCWIVAKI